MSRSNLLFSHWNQRNHLKHRSICIDETVAQGLKSFDASGFTLGTDASYNSSGPYSSWSWVEGSTPGFDVLTYTGNATIRNISHNAGLAPGMMLFKDLTSSSDIQTWRMYHTPLLLNYDMSSPLVPPPPQDQEQSGTVQRPLHPCSRWERMILSIRMAKPLLLTFGQRSRATARSASLKATVRLMAHSYTADLGQLGSC